jgi:hypothetical protein
VKVDGMLKNVIRLVLVGTISVVAITAGAADSVGTKSAKTTLSITNNIISKEAPMQATSISSGEAKSNMPQNTDEMPTGWLLTMALFGFVILSNRSGV